MFEKLTLTNDGAFDIATGRSRKETSWKNKKMLWSEFIQKVSTTHRSAETHAEYMSAKKPRQDEIKDIGGFVGGYVTGGRRKAGNIINRSILTLDVDFATLAFWDSFKVLFGNAAIIYSTHKHCPDSPRYRLILILKRTVMADEYEAIARYIAGVLGIECFDPTTFQPERLMYWPSTSKDGVYEFNYQDGIFLDADEILASYHDWKDSSAWPVSSKVDTILHRSIVKQGDPLEKPGVIGAFCRTYTIQEVIEKYLSDVYEVCDIENRYSYKEGSTAGGLIVYDDKYTYSHHGTDPISGKLCNAFDLVRIHKFGLKDEDSTIGTKSNLLPSFKAMEVLAANDPDVRKRSAVERIGNAKSDFAEALEEISAEELDTDKDDWLKELEVDRKSKPLSTINNIYLVLKNDVLLRSSLMYDEFQARLVVLKNLPWQKLQNRSRDFGDLDFDNLAHFLEHRYGMPFTQLQKALSKIATTNYIHPVRNYLNSLKWDGVERLDTLLIDYLGAENNEYTRAVTRKTLVAAVARVQSPGIKFDTVLTLVGKQGGGKSTIINKLAKEWFSDNLGKVSDKEGAENLRGVWIMEIAELASFRKTDVEAVKKFITCREDVYRPSYGKFNIRFPRQCIFFATTNKFDFLTDPTGNRRFLPIATHVTEPVKNIFTDLTDNEIDQLWAEATTYYQQGESIDLSSEVKEMAEAVRESHTVYDDRAGLVEKYLNTLFPENWEQMSIYDRRSFLQGDELAPKGTMPKNVVCVAEIICEVFGGHIKDMDTNSTKPVHEILQKLKGWVRIKGTRKFSVYGYQRAYERETQISAVFVEMTDKTNTANTINTVFV